MDARGLVSRLLHGVGLEGICRDTGVESGESERGRSRPIRSMDGGPLVRLRWARPLEQRVVA